MSNVQRIERVALNHDLATKGRIESGAIQFIDEMGQLDWPALHLRGDDAISIAFAIQAVEEQLNDMGVSKDSLWYIAYFQQLIALKDTILTDVAMQPRLKEDEETEGQHEA